MINKKLPLTSLLLLAALLGGLVVAATIYRPARAADASQFRAGRIIDDAIFFNQNTMDTNAIQQFLNAKVPVCDTWHASSDPNNQPPFTCLKDYSQSVATRSAEAGLCNGITAGTKSSAQIIFEVAQSCGINPEVLLILLQKEQSLVTDTWPWNIQYRSATGYGCPDTSLCDAQYYGFFNQVYSAARQFKLYTKNPLNYNYRAGSNNYVLYNPNSACGGNTIYIENNATAALYNYTPYQPNQAALNNLYGTGDGCSSYGNRNFWRMFTDWFGTTIGSDLIKGSGATVYVRSSDPTKAYGIPSGDLIYAYGLQTTGITPVSDSYLASLNTSGQLTNIFTKPSDNTIYLADNGVAYGIASGTYCTLWGLPCNTPSLVSSLPYSITGRMPTGQPLGNLMVYDNTLFQLDNGTKRPFLDAGEKALSPWAQEQPITLRIPYNAGQPSGLPLLYSSRFIKLEKTNAIYYSSGGQYFTFGSFDNFKNWAANSSVLLDRYSSFNGSPPAATILPDIITDGSTYYLVNGSVRYALPASTPTGPTLNVAAYTQLNALLQSKPLVTADNTHAYQLPGGTIVTLLNGKLRPIPSLLDLQLLFDPTNIQPVSNSLLQAYPAGQLDIPAGRIVKPADGPAMYLYGGDGNLWALGDMNQLNQTLPWARNTIVVAPFTSVQYSSINVFSSIVTIAGTYYAVQPDSSIRALPNSILSAQKDTVSMPLSGPLSSGRLTDTKGVAFIRLDNGTIFKVSSTNIQPLSSLSTYFNLGGTDANTVHLPISSLNAFNIGSPL